MMSRNFEPQLTRTSREHKLFKGAHLDFSQTGKATVFSTGYTPRPEISNCRGGLISTSSGTSINPAPNRLGEFRWAQVSPNGTELVKRFVLLPSRSGGRKPNPTRSAVSQVVPAIFFALLRTSARMGA